MRRTRACRQYSRAARLRPSSQSQRLHGMNGLRRALLLLDSSAGRPWAYARNVRIELQAEAGKAVGTLLR